MRWRITRRATRLTWGRRRRGYTNYNPHTDFITCSKWSGDVIWSYRPVRRVTPFTGVYISLLPVGFKASVLNMHTTFQRLKIRWRTTEEVCHTNRQYSLWTWFTWMCFFIMFHKTCLNICLLHFEIFLIFFSEIIFFRTFMNILYL